MPTQTSSAHCFLSWAKSQLMRWMPHSRRSKERRCKSGLRLEIKADQFIAQMRKKRDEFESAVKKQAEAGKSVWDSAKLQLATELKDFEAETKKYLETFGNGIEQQQAVFQSQVTAQLSAWREAADKLHAAGKEFAIERRREIDGTVSRMKADAAAAERKLQELARAGTEILVNPERRPGRNARNFRSCQSGHAGGFQTSYQFGSIAIQQGARE